MHGGKEGSWGKLNSTEHSSPPDLTGKEACDEYGPWGSSGVLVTFVIQQDYKNNSAKIKNTFFVPKFPKLQYSIQNSGYLQENIKTWKVLYRMRIKELESSCK